MEQRASTDAIYRLPRLSFTRVSDVSLPFARRERFGDVGRPYTACDLGQILVKLADREDLPLRAIR